MSQKTLDRLFILLLIVSCLFTISVAATQWRWFPTEGDWGYIAEIPPTVVNYIALLLPWVIALIYLLIRRIILKHPSRDIG